MEGAVLLIAAGLFIRSFLKLNAVHPGFDPRGVITFRVGLPPTQYQDKAQIRRFFEQLEPALAALPGFTLPGDTSASSRYFATDITEPFVLEDGRLRVPTGPGIGVEPIGALLDEFTTWSAVIDAR